MLVVFERPFTEKGIPKFLGKAGAWFTSYAELAGGSLLIFGLAKYFALCLLGIDLLIVSAAFGIMKPMWDMQFVFPCIALLIFLLVIPSQWNVISIDYVFK